MPDALQTDQFYTAEFPLGGLDVSRGFSDARPVKAPDGSFVRVTQEAVNVRAFEAGQQRMRGGSRPGLKKYIPTPLVAGWIVQELNSVVIASAANV